MKLLNEALLRLMAGVWVLRSQGAGERGQTLAEYGLLLSLIAVATVVGAVIAFREVVLQAFNDATDCFL